MTTLHYFLSGNTSQGYVTLLPQTINQLKYLILIEGPYSSENEEILNRFHENLVKIEDLSLELIHHPSSPDGLQAILIPQYNIGIISSAPPAAILTEAFTGSLITLDVYPFYQLELIDRNKAIIENISEQILQLHHVAYRSYNEALRIHDDWENIYIQEMDYGKADTIASEIAEKLIPDTHASTLHEPKRRFLGAATPQGAVDFVPNLTENVKKYFIKGRPGSGKSTLLKKLVQRGIQYGYDIEIYQCGLDPNSLDMVISRELQFAIFDSTAPHEYFPSRENDELIDMYALCITEGTDEKNAEELTKVSTAYKQKMAEGNTALVEAKKLQDERSMLTSAALNREELAITEQLIFSNIVNIMNQKRV